MKKTSTYRFSAILALLVISAFLVSCTQTPQAQTEAKRPATDRTPTGATYNVEITKDGYTPQTIAIKAGDTITFTNKDTTPHWIASASHPTHTVYPGSDIKLCGSTEQDTIFDACKGLTTGESFTFTFYEKGSWNYHDHLNVAQPFFGKIIVE